MLKGNFYQNLNKKIKTKRVQKRKKLIKDEEENLKINLTLKSIKIEIFHFFLTFYKNSKINECLFY